MQITFPKSKTFFSDLILQRTNAFIQCGGGDILKKWMDGEKKVHLVDYLLDNNQYENFMKITIKSYLEEIEEFKNIINNEEINNLVSIGPGNGVFETLLLQKIKFKKILMIDLEETKSQNHGFNKLGSGYANLINTKKFMIDNSIPEKSIIICNPKKQKLPRFKFNLLISFFSMGFHYPCDEYVDFIIKNGSFKSNIIYDKRRNVYDEGHDVLQKQFLCLRKISNIKHDRIFMEKIIK
tara:strand:- start:315 stop:1028 length:714 start_codon:yes stop_codon:yes gene_type:complete